MAEYIYEYIEGKNDILKGELVRCKDCKHLEERAFKTEDGDILEFNYCKQWKSSVNTKGFCYKGEQDNEVEE